MFRTSFHFDMGSYCRGKKYPEYEQRKTLYVTSRKVAGPIADDAIDFFFFFSIYLIFPAVLWHWG
jgi:hypothetical protein